MVLSPEEIAERCEHKEGIANIRSINALFRQQDESDKFPIFGTFNVTERAIRKARKLQSASAAVYGLEYAYMLDQFISSEVNNESNW